ncbi:MAG: tRNA (adenosine(37)-N6)-threonylcarbamoyltransferase complex transferase subunit TsaD [Hyphomicrobiales bacterium]|nr:tRNA (adenosine(37)-N6)-threonylcarbamoyltransferase complex transferase subunit TsaD [Hyphomicrobiales bacterium]PCJ85881.1 MAG: tRNA (adenosine(37)-N6)-threonylcarbamoyltransferase complex transferase subunit TsaD [Hyphomicrobiales bacterium]
MRILGIETSCDETAASVVTGTVDADGTPHGIIASNIVLSQKDHAAFGGVVPEIAARAHVEALDQIIQAAMTKAECDFTDLDAIAVTAGPGLIGGLIVGLMGAKAVSIAHDVPLIGVSHLEGHALTVRLSDGLSFPYLLLLVSGGHTQMLLVSGLGKYQRLGTTIDDALGEAFDKTAKLLGLGYPGGPAVERAALLGDKNRIPLPRPLYGKMPPNFSFSGLKTALRQEAQKLADISPLTEQDVADLCASFQNAVSDVLDDRVSRAWKLAADMSGIEDMLAGKPLPIVVAGGVAANKTIRAQLQTTAEKLGTNLVAAPMALCGDNAAMIAWAGLEHFNAGHIDDLSLAPRPRWPLDKDAQPLVGRGKAGPKV